MKKFLKIALILILAFALFVVGYRLFGPKREYFMTEEECAQRVVGTWIDPLWDYPPYVFNADGTGYLGDLPVTWEVGNRWNKQPEAGYHNSYFWLVCKVEGSDNRYSVCFDYYDDIDVFEASSYLISSPDGSRGRGGEYELYEHIDRKAAHVDRYKADEYELIFLDETNWDEYFTIAHRENSHFNSMQEWCWGYDNYIVVRPEYAARVMNCGKPEYAYRCEYLYTLTPYFVDTDAKEQTVVLREPNLSAEPVVGSWKFPREYENGMTEPPYLSSRSLVEEWDFGMELGRIELPVRDGEDYTYVIEDYEVQSASGMLLLAKAPADAEQE